MNEAKQETAGSRMAAARARLAAALKPAEPEPEPEATPQEWRAARRAKLRAMRGRSYQLDFELAWLDHMATRDRLDVEIEQGAREINALRAAHREASQRLGGLKSARDRLRGIEADRVLEAAREQAPLSAELGAIEAAVRELERRIREADHAQRARTAERNKLTALAQAALARAGL